jgi:hypothetical protein
MVDGACLNCGATLAGPYCHECGQYATTGRYTLRRLANEHYNFFGKINSDIVRTFVRLAKDPGGFCREYLQGRRRGYSAPLNYLFSSFFAAFTLFASFHWVFPRVVEGTAPTLDLTGQSLVLVGTLLWGVAFRVVSRRSGYNVAEYSVCMMYLYAEINVVSAVLTVATAAFTGSGSAVRTGVSAIFTGVAFVYLSGFMKQLLGITWPRAVLTHLAVAGLFAFMMIPTFLAWLVVAGLLAAK